MGADHQRPTIKRIAEGLQKKYIIQNLGAGQAGIKFDLDADEMKMHFATNTAELTRAIQEQISSDAAEVEYWVSKETETQFIESFCQGSQIHQNAIIMYELGMPIIKIDSVYRGVLSVSDAENLSTRLPHEERSLLKEILYSRLCAR